MYDDADLYNGLLITVYIAAGTQHYVFSPWEYQTCQVETSERKYPNSITQQNLQYLLIIANPPPPRSVTLFWETPILTDRLTEEQGKNKSAAGGPKEGFRASMDTRPFSMSPRVEISRAFVSEGKPASTFVMRLSNPKKAKHEHKRI